MDPERKAEYIRWRIMRAMPVSRLRQMRAKQFVILFGFLLAVVAMVLAVSVTLIETYEAFAEWNLFHMVAGMVAMFVEGLVIALLTAEVTE